MGVSSNGQSSSLLHFCDFLYECVWLHLLVQGCLTGCPQAKSGPVTPRSQSRCRSLHHSATATTGDQEGWSATAQSGGNLWLEDLGKPMDHTWRNNGNAAQCREGVLGESACSGVGRGKHMTQHSRAKGGGGVAHARVSSVAGGWTTQHSRQPGVCVCACVCVRVRECLGTRGPPNSLDFPVLALGSYSAWYLVFWL